MQHRGGAVRPLERQALEHRRARTPLPTAVGPAADADQTVGGAADADLQTVGPAAAPQQPREALKQPHRSTRL